MDTDLESQPSVELFLIDEELKLEDDAATTISKGMSQSGKKKRKKCSKVCNYLMLFLFVEFDIVCLF